MEQGKVSSDSHTELFPYRRFSLPTSDSVVWYSISPAAVLQNPQLPAFQTPAGPRQLNCQVLCAI